MEMLLHDLPIHAAILVSVFQECSGMQRLIPLLTNRLKWAEGRFQMICYGTGEPLGISGLQLHQELTGDVAA